LDAEIFQNFLILFASGSAELLSKHIEIAEGYIRAIKAALATGYFRSVVDAAHPLKSSSRQIGALRVSELAARIEDMAQEPAPDAAKIAQWVVQIEHEQQLATQAIHEALGKAGLAGLSVSRKIG
jgi:HPt (histidine-containing phosphotransfer) domain-containing protein